MALAPWLPPVDVFTLEKRAAIEADIAIGTSAGPWAAKLSKDARSVRNLFSRHGISTTEGQQGLLDDLLLQGFEITAFRRTNRGTAQGIRSPDGRPDNVVWLQHADDSAEA